MKYFQWAKQQGDLLVVGVNTDAGIRRLKGAKRPIINEEDRVGVLEELESIDYLVSFDDGHADGVDRADPAGRAGEGGGLQEGTGRRVGCRRIATAGESALAPLMDGRSTSAVIQKILDAYK